MPQQLEPSGDSVVMVPRDDPMARWAQTSQVVPILTNLGGGWASATDVSKVMGGSQKTAKRHLEEAADRGVISRRTVARGLVEYRVDPICRSGDG